MGLEAEKPADAAARLIAAGRVLLAQGDAGFSLTRLCAEAGVTLADFRASFSGKAELLQQLMDQKPAPAPQPPQADPWLERRLRVFERALSALEDKAETRDRETRTSLARLEERLAEFGGTQRKLDVTAAAELAVQAEPVAVEPEITVEAAAEPEKPEEPNPLLLAPLEAPPVPRLEAEVLDQARRAALAHGRKLETRRRRAARIPERMLIAGTLAILILFACAALTLVNAGGAPAHSAGGAVAVRALPVSPLAQLAMRADGGDVTAQRQMAQAYLAGEGVTRDVDVAQLWARAAADGGDAQAQYLLATLLRSGAARDARDAVAWFAKAADAGQVKAMHSLGLAYAMGDGVARDEGVAASWFAKGAARGFVDSAFNLAVLYERGHGVAQDPRQALRWYRAAAKAGDRSAASRAQFLAQQVGL
jgi:TPR repeat protein